VILWVAVLILKLGVGAFIPLMLDETYYWVWSHHLQLGYLDHPPAIAWLFWLGHPFEGWGHAVRWPGLLLGHMTLVLWWPLLRRVLDRDQRRWWLVLVLLSPLTGPGSMILTPDVPMLFFWSLALLLLLRWADHPTLHGAIALGAALGLGFDSKYPIVVFLPLALIWLWREGRLELLHPRWLALGLVGFAATSWPVWLWNATNEWASFSFQLGHGLGGGSWEPRWTLEYLAVQFALIFPTVALLAIWQRRKAPAWLVIFGWGPVLFFLLTSFRGYVEANWPVAAYPTLIALALYGRSRFRWATTTAAIWGTLLVVMGTHLAWWWIPLERDRLRHELSVFDHLHELVLEHQPLYADSYQMASKLSYDLGLPVYQLRGMGRVSFYTYLAESVPNTDSYFLAVERGWTIPTQQWERSYEEVRRIPAGDTHVVIEFRVRPTGPE
jgi:4-amino-4-deoxy-L-arabinose transferase-like glycosyltransferase